MQGDEKQQTDENKAENCTNKRKPKDFPIKENLSLFIKECTSFVRHRTGFYNLKKGSTTLLK